MPNLWRRSQSGARFTPLRGLGRDALRSSACSAAPGAEARGDDGRGRRPVLFPALRKNGYAVKVLSASCLDWMDLRDTVFAGVSASDLKNRRDGDGWGDHVPAPRRRLEDGAVPRSAALAFLVAAARFRCRRRRAVQASLGRLRRPATTAPPETIRTCAKNAAHPRRHGGGVPRLVRARGRGPSCSSRRPRRVQGEGPPRSRLGGDERADPHAVHESWATGSRRATRRAHEPRRRGADLLAPRGHARRRSTPTACRCSRRPRIGSCSPPSDGSRVTRWSGKTSRSRCTPASPARRSPTPTTGRSQMGTHASPRTQGGSCVRCAARRSAPTSTQRPVPTRARAGEQGR